MVTCCMLSFTGAASSASPPVDVPISSELLPNRDLARLERHHFVLYAPRPEYSYEARSKHLEGRGSYIMHVRRDGSVSRVEVVRSTGHMILDHAVVRALRQWRFKPGVFTALATPVASPWVF
jgi:TonB family protein